jgi:hypothetical protein
MYSKKILLAINLIISCLYYSLVSASVITIVVNKNSLIGPLNFQGVSTQGMQATCQALTVDPPTIKCNYTSTGIWGYDLKWNSILNPTCTINLHIGDSIQGGPGQIISPFNDYNFLISPMAWNPGDVTVFMTIKNPNVLGCR